MKIDFATLAFGYSIQVGGGTPNWATSLGQSRERKYRINEDPEINELLKGLTYKSVPLSRISSKIGKGGRMSQGNDKDSPIILAALFDKAYINNTMIDGGRFIILVTRDTSESHAGRLRFKYGPSNTYEEELGKRYSNEMFWNTMRSQLGLATEACFFVYDISVSNQDELHLKTVIVDKEGTRLYHDSAEHHEAWEHLVSENNEKYGWTDLPNLSVESYGIHDDNDELTPKWFEAKASEFPTLDQEARDFLNRFFNRFSIAKLTELSGKDLLNEVFLNRDNKSNLCYVLEFDSECRNLFGGIKSGTAYKYGLHYSKKNGSWATGSSMKPVFISEDEAINLATQIRDSLVAGAELIDEAKGLESEDDYLKLYNDLVDVTDGYINRVWFLKYYAMRFPDLFPVFYSRNIQMNVINKLKLQTKDNPISRMGEIAAFVRKCNISNVMFGRIFGTYCSGDDLQEETDSDGVKMKNCLEIIRPSREKSIFSLNTIIYGAPGTGKTYSMAEYALAIIEHRNVDLTYKNSEDRKKVMQSYNDYVKAGRIVFTTFHQNYGYEEFVQGLRPDVKSEEMSFKVVDGVFKKIADTALNETDYTKDYVLIIDEINRANISKVFGELITLIEEDKRWGEVNQTSVTLQSGDVFAVPNNLYIIGTMNSADKSISLIDAALRRRFEFIEQKPDPGLVKDSEIQKFFKKLNKTLAYELQSSDLLIGHSYFMGKTMDELPKIMNNSIVPLLYEYFYDNKKKVMSVLDSVLKDTGYEVYDPEIGRVSVRTKKGEE